MVGAIRVAPDGVSEQVATAAAVRIGAMGLGVAAGGVGAFFGDPVEVLGDSVAGVFRAVTKVQLKHVCCARGCEFGSAVGESCAFLVGGRKRATLFRRAVVLDGGAFDLEMVGGFGDWLGVLPDDGMDLKWLVGPGYVQGTNTIAGASRHGGYRRSKECNDDLHREWRKAGGKKVRERLETNEWIGMGTGTRDKVEKRVLYL